METLVSERNRMEELRKLILDMKSDLQLKLVTMENSLIHLEDKITTNINNNVNEKFKKLDSNLNHLNSQIEEQEKRLDELEKNVRQRNVIFFGIEEGETSYFELAEKVLKIIQEKLKISIQRFEVESVRRLGKRTENNRPVAVAFTTLGMKINVLKNKKQLAASRIYIKHEYPPKVLKIREQLQHQLKLEKEKGNEAFINYDKLIVKSSNEKPNNKRAPSSSPPDSAHSEGSVSFSRTNTKKKLKASNQITSYMKQCDKTPSQTINDINIA